MLIKNKDFASLLVMATRRRHYLFSLFLDKNKGWDLVIDTLSQTFLAWGFLLGNILKIFQHLIYFKDLL